MDNPFRIVINEDQWCIYVISDEDDSITTEDAAAETDPYKKEIYFRKGDISLDDVRHEVFHAFFSYTYTRTGDLTHHQTEEVAAELFAQRAERMILLAKEIYNNLIDLRDYIDKGDVQDVKV